MKGENILDYKKPKGRCRDCEYLELTRKVYSKPWTCTIKNKNKKFEDIIFKNLCQSFKNRNKEN